MLVRCKHYSTLYPDGGHNVGDIFDISKSQAEYFEQIGWIESLPQQLQPEVKKGRKKRNEVKCAVDLSKSKTVDKHLEHIYK